MGYRSSERDRPYRRSRSRSNGRSWRDERYQDRERDRDRKRDRDNSKERYRERDRDSHRRRKNRYSSSPDTRSKERTLKPSETSTPPKENIREKQPDIEFEKYAHLLIDKSVLNKKNPSTPNPPSSSFGPIPSEVSEPSAPTSLFSAPKPTPPVLPEVLTPENEHKHCAVFLSNIPPETSEEALKKFVNGAIAGVRGANPKEYNCLEKISNFSSGSTAILLFQNLDDACLALRLTGLMFGRHSLFFKRPLNYIPPLGGDPVLRFDQTILRVRRELMPSIPVVGLGGVEGPLALTSDGERKEKDAAAGMALAIPGQGLTVPLSTLLCSNVTQMPTSVSQRILRNPMVNIQVRNGRRVGETPTTVVQLLNVVYPEDLIVDSTFATLVNDIKEEAKKYGVLNDVIIPRQSVDDTELKPGVGKIFLVYDDVTSARKAQLMLNGRRFDQKRVVCASFFPPQRLEEGFYTLA